MVMGRKTRLFSVLLTAESEKVISGGERKVGREVEREVGRDEVREGRSRITVTIFFTFYRYELLLRFNSTSNRDNHV